MNMKAIAGVAFALFLLGAVSAAAAKTTSKTIAVSAQIVPGNTVSAYLVNGGVHTIVTRDGARNIPDGTGLPLIRIGFDTLSSWYLVKRVDWDKRHSSLTIDF